jgi:hypothetical protein
MFFEYVVTVRVLLLEMATFFTSKKALTEHGMGQMGLEWME